jgi:diguanylate cyclase (GGDEF)-like protein/PAS domain S-box-containing protein
MTGSGDPDYQELYENAPCGYLSTDAAGVITRVNETLLKWTGYRRDDLVGKHFRFLLDVGSQIFYETRYLSLLRVRGEIREVALAFRRADELMLPVLVNSTLISDENGAAKEIRVAIFDSTARQDYERELLAARHRAESSETRVRVLQGASSAFGLADSVDVLAEALVDTARDAFAAAAASVLLIDGDGEFHPIAGTNPIDEEMDGGLRTLIAESAAVIGVVTASATDDGGIVSDTLRRAWLEAVSVVPLIDGGLVTGVLVCFFGRNREFDEVFIELQEALARQASQVLRRIRLQRQLEQNALYDQLTGLANRTLLRERMTEAIETTVRLDRPLAMIFVDLDGFKAVNDEIDHSAGDAVLQVIAARIRGTVREDDLVGRFGGDEFVVICEDADESAAEHIAERIRVAVRQPLRGVADGLPVTASIGVAVFRPDALPPLSSNAIFRAADAAMYQSKNAGKDRMTLVSI